MYDEDSLLPVSALQHLLFCQRQCALIHIEGMWDENALTAEGRIAHERVDEGGSEIRGGRRIAFGLQLRSMRLGLIGKADAVEFVEATGGILTAFPIEYKRGRPKQKDCDRVQICAQALCLEEMLGIQVEAGALFYGKTRRRENVRFDAVLRRQTVDAVSELHRLIRSGITPAAEYSQKCRSCSLYGSCMPRLSAAGRALKHYLETAGRD